MKKTILRGLLTAWLVMLGAKAEAALWETDFAQASINASQTGSYLLLDFSGSDWCGWCMKLDREVFSKAEFEAYAKTNLICVLLDFPQQKPLSNKLKEQNAGLANKYGIEGYPTVLLLSPEGKLVARTGYQEGGAMKYVAYLKRLIDADKAKRPKRNAKPKAPAK